MRTVVLALDYTPAVLRIAGDCVFLHGEHDDYVTLKEELQPLVDRNIPLHMSMGNHDNRERFWGVFPEHQKRSARIICASLAVHRRAGLILSAVAIQHPQHPAVVPGPQRPCL